VQASDPDGGIEQVDDGVPGGVQLVGGGADGDGFAGADRAEDEGALGGIDEP
jgi:hypothetical protein